MNEQQLRHLIDQVKDGSLTRRRFISMMAGLGLTGPMATQMLAWSGVAAAQSAAQAVPPYKPTRRGGGGMLRLLWWQAPTLLNPHFGVGQKDLDGSSLFYEPLATWDPEANLIPILAAKDELDPVKRAALFIRMNDLVIENHVVIPLVSAPESGAVSNKLRMTLSGWESHLSLLKDWYREG